MSIKTKFNGIARGFWKQSHRLKAASPTILVVAGIGSLLAAGVVATRKVSEFESVLDRTEKDLERAPKTRSAQAQIYGKLVVDGVRVFAPALGLAAFGTSAVLWSHGVMKRREASLIAAYGLLEQGYNAYRERVRRTVGEELEEDIYNGNDISVTDIRKDKNGKLQVDYEAKPGVTDLSKSPYAVSFDRTNRNWNDARPEYNLVFLRAQERYANHLLQTRGHVFLNDVYDGLGIDRTPAGAVVGWMRDGDDGYIDFGLFDAGSPEESDYFHYYSGDTEILLDFNVDGLIYRSI